MNEKHYNNGATEDDAWRPLLAKCGDMLKPGRQDGDTYRSQVVARSYALKNAARKFGFRTSTLADAIKRGEVKVFVDPEERKRIPAQAVHDVLDDPEQLAAIAGYERMRSQELAIVSDYSLSEIRKHLKSAGLSVNKPRWRDVQGQWGLPETLQEFHHQLKEQKANHREHRKQKESERKKRIQWERQRERERIQQLRSDLVDNFPDWHHEDRVNQCIFLHVGPPNSGKTHHALNALAESNNGWYLAPLRLLAFEIFDRLNARGVPCNLLTGEESIPIPGATITAATIEMFNPNHSGDCVIIDEAQMLADPDRGWAWTRALMEAQASEIHVIGPPTAQGLIQQMADAASIPVEVVEHERLTPIRIADKHWHLEQLPDHTILVAFSRRVVLHLKTILERMNRSVSVVYGSLPPEVRRKQADRFANGETEICIATDAVGMGLNLPADCVCFYEIEKYDGKQLRQLTPGEVQQIGGRAGRYGFATDGIIGATTRQNLDTLRDLFHRIPQTLTHARVAPTEEDLSIIPGSLPEQLMQWAELESIPDKLRSVVKTSDLVEQVELAGMLTDHQVQQLGLGAALTLIKAPTRRGTRTYWLDCAYAILANQPMPFPTSPPSSIENETDLEDIENSIACADIYMWLARRQEFTNFGPEEDIVRETRLYWSTQVDNALLTKLNMAKRCPECGKPLPARHRFRLCNECHSERFH